MKRFRNLLAAGLIALVAQPALAETFGESVMAANILADLPAAIPLTWQHARALPAAPEGSAAPAGGWQRLKAEPSREITLTLEADDKLSLREGQRILAEFPKSAPHPILLMFLENVMRVVSQETGGSPHYIRNRMRMNLGAAEVSEGILKIRPFAQDRNAARFGAFAELEIEVQWREGAPAEILSLSASLPSNPALYSETFRLKPRGE